ncbi:hypothetical protein MCOR25_006459 [Pyricularia grisea]|uniref:Uncharacterized protein n=1 Tax=Pyricularia grisea TaxID=148305 RepID=A0A6P8ANG0_PYRGI|nr:uncharacterized protein PgNI_11531 [Pyricularia grisea]KAI6361554.1 hypothetical protein MCOR25_006459 [Pyricularia grisea]TLD03565.1 hypothetical protein PgNI_11531 [Pyricularia grisea]
MFYMGNERDNVRRIRLAESVDGRTWRVDPEYVVVPGDVEGQNVSAANLWEWDGQLYVIYHASNGQALARTIDRTLRNVGHEPIVLHQMANDGRVASPQVVYARQPNLSVLRVWGPVECDYCLGKGFLGLGSGLEEYTTSMLACRV